MQGTHMSNVPFDPQLQTDSLIEVLEPVGGAVTCSLKGLLEGHAGFSRPVFLKERGHEAIMLQIELSF